MFTLLLILHVIGCASLITVVLFQAGKGAGLSNVFGSTSSSDAVFGGKGPAGFLAKATTVIAILFMLTSFVLAFMSSKKTEKSIMDEGEKSLMEEEGKTTDEKTTSKLQIKKPKIEERTSKLDEVEEETDKDSTKEKAPETEKENTSQ